MAAPICKTSRAEPSRSTRAISEACSEVGTATCCAGWSRSLLSSTALVSSSTNSGTPSVRSMICSSSAGGSGLPPVTCSTSVMRSRRPRRLSVMLVTCGWPAQGGWKSGRWVMTSRIGKPCMRSTVSVSSSSEVGSLHCTSSNAISTGALRARLSSRPSSAASTSLRLRFGSIGVALCSGAARPTSSASRLAAAALSSLPCASSFSSLARFCAGVSSRAKSAACWIWVTIGCKALPWVCGRQK